MAMSEDSEVGSRGSDSRDEDPSCCGCGCPCSQGEAERLKTALCCSCHEPS